MMTVLRRRNPARRMARFYGLSLQWTLGFGDDWSADLIREWGRIGSPGTDAGRSAPGSRDRRARPVADRGAETTEGLRLSK